MAVPLKKGENERKENRESHLGAKEVKCFVLFVNQEKLKCLTQGI